MLPLLSSVIFWLLLPFTDLPIWVFSLFRSSSSHESVLCQKQACYFLLNTNEVHLNLPLLTCWPASCLPSLLLCLDLTFFVRRHIVTWIFTFPAFHAFVIHSVGLLFLSPSCFFSFFFNCCCKARSTNAQFRASLFAPAFHCSTTLGMESGKISDDQISASTTFYDNRWSPRQARLNNNDNAWTPSEDSNKEYIQVRLYFLILFFYVAPLRGRSHTFYILRILFTFNNIWKPNTEFVCLKVSPPVVVSSIHACTHPCMDGCMHPSMHASIHRSLELFAPPLLAPPCCMSLYQI